jgi:hypothetical protein
MTQDDPTARAERDLEDLERRTERLAGEIADAKEQLVENADDSVAPAIEGAIGDEPENTDEPEAEGAPKGWA